MPISYDDKDWEFEDLVEHIKRTKPHIKSPGGYVKTIEEKQRGGQLLTRMANILEKVATDEETDKIKEIRKKAEKYNQPADK